MKSAVKANYGLFACRSTLKMSHLMLPSNVYDLINYKEVNCYGSDDNERTGTIA